MVKNDLHAELKKLRKELPKGYREILATAHGITPSHVDSIFNGTRENLEVIKSAVVLAKSYKKEIISLTEEIKSLSEE